eukprot:scaffold4771_cov129-Isochrysis_galbana.AAC.11
MSWRASRMHTERTPIGIPERDASRCTPPSSKSASWLAVTIPSARSFSALFGPIPATSSTRAAESARIASHSPRDGWEMCGARPCRASTSPPVGSSKVAGGADPVLARPRSFALRAASNPMLSRATATDDRSLRASWWYWSNAARFFLSHRFCRRSVMAAAAAAARACCASACRRSNSVLTTWPCHNRRQRSSTHPSRERLCTCTKQLRRPATTRPSLTSDDTTPAASSAHATACFKDKQRLSGSNRSPRTSPRALQKVAAASPTPPLMSDPPSAPKSGIHAGSASESSTVRPEPMSDCCGPAAACAWHKSSRAALKTTPAAAGGRPPILSTSREGSHWGNGSAVRRRSASIASARACASNGATPSSCCRSDW